MADRFDDLAERVQLDCESYLLRGSIDGRKRIIREALIAAHATGKDEADEGLRRGMAQTILLSKLPLPLEIVEETTTLRASLARAEAERDAERAAHELEKRAHEATWQRMAARTERAEKAEAERDAWHRQYIMMSEAQASALSGESEAVRRAEAAELGCEIAYRREPTQAEGDAHEDDHGCDCCEDDCQRCAHLAPLGIKSGECFVPMGGWTGRRCRVCNRWVWGGPPACAACVAREERDALDARVAKAEEVVSCARVLGTYDWESRLDDSRPSDDAKIDARELGIAVWHYDEFVRAHAAKAAPKGDKR